MLYQILLFERSPFKSETEDHKGSATGSVTLTKLMTRDPEGAGGVANDKMKHSAYTLLYEFQKHKERILKHLDLPQYSVPLHQIQPDKPANAKDRKDPVVIKTAPQVSYF
jgi:hypothetical protein